MTTMRAIVLAMSLQLGAAETQESIITRPQLGVRAKPKAEVIVPAAPPPGPAFKAAVTGTTTMTPWDSSSGSSADASNSLVSDSLNGGSSMRSGSSASSGSQESGSSGSYMNVWLWFFVITALLCCIGAALAGGATKGKKKAKKKAKKAAPAPEPVAEVEALLPPLMPLMAAPAPMYSMVAPATTSYQVAPQMQYASAPVTTAYEYAQPVQYAAAPVQYAAAPVQYAAAPMQYAAPAVEYVQYAAPTEMIQAAPVIEAVSVVQ